MSSHEVITINFVDKISNDEAVIIVRESEGDIALCISLRHNGDIEVAMEKKEGEVLIEALNKVMNQVPND